MVNPVTLKLQLAHNERGSISPLTVFCISKVIYLSFFKKTAPACERLSKFSTRISPRCQQKPGILSLCCAVPYQGRDVLTLIEASSVFEARARAPTEMSSRHPVEVSRVSPLDAH